MPEFYKYLFLIFILWNLLFSIGFTKEEYKRKNFSGIFLLIILQLTIIFLFSSNFIKY